MEEYELLELENEVEEETMKKPTKKGRYIAGWKGDALTGFGFSWKYKYHES